MIDAPRYVPATATHDYDPETNCYNLRGDNIARFAAGLANAEAGTGPLDVAWGGDSSLIGYGDAVGPTGYKSFYSIPRAFALELAAQTGCSQPGINSTHPAVGAYASSFGDRWATTGAAMITASGDIMVFNGAGTARYTSHDKGTAVRFAYPNNGRPFTYQVDALAPVTVTPGTDNTELAIAITGLANATHTILFTFTAGTGIYSYVSHAGVYTPGLAQISSHTLAIGGTRANSGASAEQNWSNTAVLNAGLGYTAFAGLAALGVTPHLFLASVGGNDQAALVPTATIKQGLRNVFNLARSYWPSIDLGLVNFWKVGGTSSTDYDALAGARYEVADEYDCFVYDLNWAVDELAGATANGLVGPDGTHPTSAASTAQGRRMARILAQAA